MRWSISLLAIFGAFFLAGIGGSVIADVLGLWWLPLSGFLAAFSVVSVAYLSAPMNSRKYASIAFVFGALIALLLLKNEWYPESYGSRAYQDTWYPFMATFLGGALALGIVWLPYRNEDV